MTFNWNRFWRVMGIFAVLDLCILAAGCSTAWTTEATNIIQLLVPAIEAALGILSAFGVGLPANALSEIESWAQQGTNALTQVKALIAQYNTAEATAQPGILQEINTLLGVVSSNLAQLLSTIHITDPTTQAKVMAIFQAISSEVQALITLLPAIQGKVTNSEELKQLLASSGYMTPKEFKKSFNEQAGYFGAGYEI